MLSCHPEPFAAFIRDLQIDGCTVHLYRGANTYACLLLPETAQGVVEGLHRHNLYFLAGVTPGLQKRASDSDVLKRGMFTLDFDIRKELEKDDEESGEKGRKATEQDVFKAAELILQQFVDRPPWDQMRYVVLSGNGMHIHYFGEPVTVKKEEWVAGMKDIFEEVNAFSPIPCDMGCGNAGRIMRLPGSWNVKGESPLKVEFLAWMPGASLAPLKFVQERGALAITRRKAVFEAERKEFAALNPDGGSDVVDIINAIPIEMVVQQVLNCRVSAFKQDGGLRFVDESGKERGFFKHHQHNIIVHEGTALFPAPAGVGYNPLGLVKAVKGWEAREAILWFAERSQPVRDAIAKEKEEWAREHAAKELKITENWFPPKK